MYIIQLLKDSTYFTATFKVKDWDELDTEDFFTDRNQAIEKAQQAQCYEGNNMIKLWQVYHRSNKKEITVYKLPVTIPTQNWCNEY
ncbi:hypothetical protein [Iningainema tapete]|uniref:Uncharacterized protein n=1 Tax=Iningainema tapete BLCC-T55 TaxID=2748662 RepID=A0A8J6XNE4_9CYAN|nr:hypothetical protein [Iningainema tapete]MBD2775084.1 hypothetical protein [Iningainema tapete BLCC-T55]